MKLTGAKVTLVQQCTGIDGMWGLRAENAEHQRGRSPRSSATQIDKADGEVVAGDCHLANGGIIEQTGQPAAAPAPGRGPRLRHLRGDRPR